MCEAGISLRPVNSARDIDGGMEGVYTGLLEGLQETLTEKMKKQMFLEELSVTYSFIHMAINADAFPAAPVCIIRSL